MRITVLTTVINGATTIDACLASVTEQQHPEVEHVVIDGGSTDGTVRRLEAAGVRFVSEPDRGLYEAINKGLRLARGDAIGVLGADDVYADRKVLSDVAKLFDATGCEAVYGDLVYVDADDPSRVVRSWVSGRYRGQADLRRGWMPAHPSFFLRRDAYERLGGYDTSLRIAADYELMLRCLRAGISVAYLPRVLVRMRLGGTSNRLGNLIRKSFEDYVAMRRNQIPRPLLGLVLKNLRKLPQFLAVEPPNDSP